ncbi:MAG: putative lipoprotein [Myxococcaceae bacterium]|nr:putative lipoprotein [Myxococcaceae bacterium]
MTSAAAIGRGWWALAIVAGAGCGPGQGAVKLVVSYAGPRDACLVIRVAPAGNSGKVEERRLDKLPHLATRTVGVIPTAGEGDAVAITIDVHQRGCEGQQVWTQQLAAKAARPAALVEAGILVRDQDDDTWADGRGSFAGGQLPGTDCDDSRAEVHPGATELCNGLDDDCNEVRDDGLPSRFFYVDLDLDGWGNAGSDAGQTACSQPPGYAADEGDCDDFRERVHPGAVESCNGVDDNCDSASDEDFGIGQECDAGSSCNARVQCSDAGTAVCVSPLPLLSWFADDDGDGHGQADGGPILSCQQPPGTIPNSDDCDDTNRFIHVGAREVCDGKDDDCDPSTLEQCSDGGLKGFTRFPMPTANAQWRAVAPFARGFAWVVGESSQIALRYFELPSGTPPPDGGLDGGADAGADGGLEASVTAGFSTTRRAAWGTSRRRGRLRRAGCTWGRATRSPGWTSTPAACPAGSPSRLTAR